MKMNCQNLYLWSDIGVHVNVWQTGFSIEQCYWRKVLARITRKYLNSKILVILDLFYSVLVLWKKIFNLQ